MYINTHQLNQSAMKIKPIQLVQSWNALNETFELEENKKDPEFTTQAKRLRSNIKLRNEIQLWNELNTQERELVVDKEIEIDIEKIEKEPKAYLNAHVDALNRFFKPELKKQQTQIEKLLEEKDNGEE